VGPGGGSVTFYLTRVGLGSSWVMGQCTEAWTHEGSGEESWMSGSSGRRTSSGKRERGLFWLFLE
jgi:hypothetical protein